MNVRVTKKAMLFASTLASAVSFAVSAGTTYQVTPLSTSGYASANAINSGGSVVGQDNQVATIWNASNQAILLPNSISNFAADGYDINNVGQAIYDEIFDYFLWTNGVSTPIPFVTKSLNDSGQIVGYDATGAVIMTNGVISPLPGGTGGVAYAINNLGHVVGSVGNDAVLWRDGVRVDLGRLPGAVSSVALGINDKDQIVGSSDGRPFLWQVGVLTELPVLESGALAGAKNINNNGEIIGAATRFTEKGLRGYLVMWKDGKIIELNLALPSSNYGCGAGDINDAGQIAVTCAGNVYRMTPTTPGADVGIAMYATNKTDVYQRIPTGQAVNFVIEAGNSGSVTATNVTVVDVIPNGMTLVSATPSQGSCSATSALTCNLGSLASGARATIQVVMQPSVTGKISQTARISMSETDINSLNDAAPVTVEIVQPYVDIDVFMSGPSVVNRYSNVTYSIAVKNNGPYNSSGVTITDALPTGMRFVSASTTVGSCSGTTTVTCNLGPMADKAKATVTIVAQARYRGYFTNTVKSTALPSDPYTYNNTSSVTTQVK